MAAENITALTDSNFNQEVLQQTGVVLVDFWAPWCGPCKMIAPIVEEIAGEYAGKIKVGKLNTDEAPQTAANFGIRSIPTLIIYKDGKPAEQIVGAIPKNQITEKLNSVLE
ncbi:thioredoxin [Fibrobacterota bacterium]